MTAQAAAAASEAADGIQLRSLVKSFRGPHGPIRAVRGIDVEIARGETVALLGPNGAGSALLWPVAIVRRLHLLRPAGDAMVAALQAALRAEATR